MLKMMKSHIMLNNNHPINIICLIFREEFGRAYRKYVRPEKNKAGVYDKVNVIKMFKEKTQKL